MHGDRGIIGARGGAPAFARMDTKVTVGHSHSAGIHDGVYTVGCLARLRQSYTRGPTSWSHTNCLLYQNGQRALLTNCGKYPYAEAE